MIRKTERKFTKKIPKNTQPENKKKTMIWAIRGFCVFSRRNSNYLFMTLFPKFLLVGVMFGSITAGAAESDTLRLSRRDCVAIALNESQTIKVADLEIKKTDYSKRRCSPTFSPP